MSTIQEVQQEIVDEFAVFDDWMDRYNYLIELANELSVIDEKKKNNDYIIKGCQSRVWLNAEFEDGKVIYSAESDAIITRGIISLLIRVLSGREPGEIINAKLEFIDQIGLKENLSPTRANGLLAMIKQMRLYAIAYDAKSKKNEQGE
ncbi:MAG: SufE family protein [Bacteroidales bacterium]|nr:SufE family protein [Bacteroidales bacterium]